MKMKKWAIAFLVVMAILYGAGYAQTYFAGQGIVDPAIGGITLPAISAICLLVGIYIAERVRGKDIV